MNMVDLFLLLPLGYVAVKGFFNGVVSEALGLLSLLLGVLLALRFSDALGAWLAPHLDPRLTSLVSFALIAIGVLTVSSVVAKMITQVLGWVALGWLNKLLGFIFGAAKMVFVLSIALLVFSPINEAMGLVEEKTINESVLYTPVQSIAPKVIPYFKEANWRQAFAPAGSIAH